MDYKYSLEISNPITSQRSKSLQHYSAVLMGMTLKIDARTLEVVIGEAGYLTCISKLPGAGQLVLITPAQGLVKLYRGWL